MRRCLGDGIHGTTHERGLEDDVASRWAEKSIGNTRKSFGVGDDGVEFRLFAFAYIIWLLHIKAPTTAPRLAGTRHGRGVVLQLISHFLCCLRLSVRISVCAHLIISRLPSFVTPQLLFLDYSASSENSWWPSN